VVIFPLSKNKDAFQDHLRGEVHNIFKGHWLELAVNCPYTCFNSSKTSCFERWRFAQRGQDWWSPYPSPSSHFRTPEPHGWMSVMWTPSVFSSIPKMRSYPSVTSRFYWSRHCWSGKFFTTFIRSFHSVRSRTSIQVYLWASLFGHDPSPVKWSTFSLQVFLFPCFAQDHASRGQGLFLSIHFDIGSIGHWK